jgi:DNA-binding NtrC family response regulator
MNRSILVVDDEESIRKLLKSRLEREGYQVVTAQNAEEAEREFASGKTFSTVVTDLKMPGKDGFGLMKALKTTQSNLKFIVITGHGEKEAAVQAVKNGASDYLEKPFDLEDFTRAVKRCESEYALTAENQDLLARLEDRLARAEGKTEDHSWYAPQSEAMKPVSEWLSVLKREAARTEAEEPTVLILGESGTGKEGIARQVQQNSRRAGTGFVAVNCANFNEQLLESELFGYEKGAFTGAAQAKRGLFELAKGGTLFLDEIGEMDVKLQAKLLRVLQEKTFRRVGGTADIATDVRIVAATNVNLSEKVSKGSFREDLYHRLSRVVIDLPALKARKEDVVPMARFFAKRAFQSRGKTFLGFSPDAESTIQNYEWPGNVRELLNVVERVALLNTTNSQIGMEALSLPRRGGASVVRLNLVQGGSNSSAGSGDGSGGSNVTSMGLATAINYFEIARRSIDPVDGLQFMKLKKAFVDQFETDYLKGMLTKHTGNVSAAAREAALDRSNFLRLLRRHKIKSNDHRPVGAPEIVEEQELKVA